MKKWGKSQSENPNKVGWKGSGDKSESNNLNNSLQNGKCNFWDFHWVFLKKDGCLYKKKYILRLFSNYHCIQKDLFTEQVSNRTTDMGLFKVYNINNMKSLKILTVAFEMDCKEFLTFFRYFCDSNTLKYLWEILSSFWM